MSTIDRKTLWDILSGPAPLRIRIPRIQRDYAHGRKNKAAGEIRTTLVGELIDSLKNEPESPDSKRVDLGLIFGAPDGDGVTLYDGQQRITTLFLLHWCLAWLARDTGASEALQRFSYNSRLHSRDFCRALATEGLALEPNGDGPSRHFPDAVWFCPAWRTDPTVAGMLVVLDLIHDSLPKGKHDSAELWGRLKKADRAPCFSWLKLDNDDSHEDLYIQLNSRGRLLAGFEKLKAWLEEHMDSWNEASLPTDWKQKLDNQWLDLFWKRSGSNTRTMDQSMLAFFLGNALNLSLAKSNDIDSELIQGVRNKEFLSKLEWLKIFTPESVSPLFLALDQITNHKQQITSQDVRAQIDQWGTNGNILKFQETDRPLSDKWIADWAGAGFRQRLLYFGLLRFLVEHPPGSPGWREPVFLRWMRLVRNLGWNSEIGRDSFRNAVRSVNSIAPGALETLDQWVSEPPGEFKPTGLDRQQWGEEIEKAKLRLAEGCGETSAALDGAEDQSFLQGQIGFLIAFATSNDGFDLGRFQSYAATMARHFPSEKGPADEDRVLLQQALLSIGDYKGGDGRKQLGSSRDDWRRVFSNERAKHEKRRRDPQDPRGVFHRFLDLGPDVDMHACIREALAELDWGDWRKWMLAAKHPLEFCKRSHFDVEESGGTVVLIRGRDHRSASAELRTYFLYKKELESQGWNYTCWRRNSHVYRVTDRIRLELHHIAHRGFALRVLCKKDNLPSGFAPPTEESFSQLRADEIEHGWKRCGVLSLQCSPDPKSVATCSEDEWRNLVAPSSPCPS